MTDGIYIVGASITAVAVLWGTGLWRLVIWPARIRASKMTVARLGLCVADGPNTERVDSILASFAGGFNAMLTGRSESVARAYCESLPPLQRPFAEEGTAMGFVPRRLFRYNPNCFENVLVKTRPEFRYLYYVGLGFWSGIRNHSPKRVVEVSEGLDPLHRFLCFDGYGFKYAFFDHPANPKALTRLEGLPGYARNAAYQGVGRAMFFRFWADPEQLITQIERLGEYAVDAAGGLGLAAAFINPDRLDIARELGLKLPNSWRDHYHLGLCFGLKARSINDVEAFDRTLAHLEDDVQAAIHASVRECDRYELLVRADGQPDSYRRWRQQVTAWMADHIEFPLTGVRSAGSTSYTPRARSIARATQDPAQHPNKGRAGT